MLSISVNIRKGKEIIM